MDFQDYYDSTRAYHHDVETVTLIRPASRLTGAETAAVVLLAHSRPATQDDVDHPLGGSLDGQTRTFHLWRVECGGIIPYNDYLVVRADGTRWVIKSVETLAHGRRFRLHCTLHPS